MNRPDPNARLRDILRVLDEALARKPRIVTPQDFPGPPATSLTVIHPEVHNG